MTILQVIVLALLQGVTEFLPISSSGHLILVRQLTPWADQLTDGTNQMMFDVALHVGTLAAVLFYFRHEIGRMSRDWLKTFTSAETTGDTRLAWQVAAGTIPAALAGLFFHDFVQNTIRHELGVIFTTTVLFGLLLGIAYTKGKRQYSEYALSMTGAVLIGTAQALALIPGTSRSGITITMALILGLTGTGAARFSFLLSIPVIVLAGGQQFVGSLGASASVNWYALAFGALAAGLTAYASIYYLLKLVHRIGMWPFAGYRLALGAVILMFMWL